MMKDFINNKDNKKIYTVIALIALAHTFITLFTDKGIFTFPEVTSSMYKAALFDYIVCKALTYLVLYGFYYMIYRLIRDDRKDCTAYKVIKSALPYLIVIVAVAAIKLPQGYLSNDEASIYNDAVGLTHSTWFCYLTPYYYTVALMIMPFKYSPIIMKLIIEYGVVGYVTLRATEHYGKKIGMISYVLFLLYPVIAYTTSAHRLPIYFLLYLALFVKLIFDYKEGKSLTYFSAFIMLLLGAVLTQWRTEGIYLAALLPLLMIIIYHKSIIGAGGKLFEKVTGERMKKTLKIATFVLVSLIFQYIVSYPQNAFMGATLDDAANDRMKPFYAYTLTNMYRNGLDLEKNKADMEIIDRYISIESLEAINEHYGDINYEDVLILYQEGFVGVRPEAGVTEFIDYSDALKRVFKNNMDVFMRTRVGAFCYAALPYHINYPSGGIKSLVSFGISLVKTVMYNLFIPLAIAIIIVVYSSIKKRWVDFFIGGGLLCHWFIVFILAPASYFKYYFPLYIMAYMYILIAIMELATLRNTKKNKSNKI